MSDTIHAFEKAGLGKAPFKFKGIYIAPGKSLIESNPNSYNAQIAALGQMVTEGGVCGCAYCGTYIIEHCLIESADGKRFFVGNECVAKTGDHGLINLAKKAKAKVATEKRHEKEALQIEELRALLNEKQEYFDTLPHPMGFGGKTLMDYADWMWKNSGNSGKVKLLKTLKTAISDPEAIRNEADAAYEGRCESREAARQGERD